MVYHRWSNEKYFSKFINILITSGIFPPDIGGPARMIEQLALDLYTKGFHVSVLTFGKDDGVERPYSVIKATGKIDFFLKLLKLSQKTGVIYTFDLYTAGFFSWLVGKVMLGKKLVVRFAGDSAWESAYNRGVTTDDLVAFQSKNYGLRIWLAKRTRSWILNGADQVIAVSNFLKGIALKIGVPEEKIKVIYNSVDFETNASSTDIKTELGLGESKLIVTAGRLVPWKGIDGLIKTLPSFKNEKLKLLVIGDGPDRGRLENLAKKEAVADKVIFVGRVPLNKMFDYYHIADVFVLNSKYEGLSHILLEALKANKPIVASNSGGNPEVIENEKNGLLVEYNNVDQLTAAIKKILTEEKWRAPEYKKICEESLKKFNWQNVVSQTIKTFEEIMK